VLWEVPKDLLAAIEDVVIFLNINGTRKETTRRETMVPTVGGQCCNDLLRKSQLRLLCKDQPIPSQGAHSIQCHSMAMAGGGLSCDLKGVLSPHSRTASASEGTRLGS